MKKSLILITTLLSLCAFSPPNKCKFKVNTIDPVTGIVKKQTEYELLTTRFTTTKDILTAQATREGNNITLNIGLTVMSDRSFDAVVKTTDYTVITLQNDSVVTLKINNEVKPSLFAQKAGVNFQYGFDLYFQLSSDQVHKLASSKIKKVEVYFTNYNNAYVSRVELKEKYTETVQQLINCVM